MSKNEFLNILRQSLEGEVDNSILEQSIKFYDEYISNNAGKSEDEVLKEIGDPRLIAKTIIETEKASSRGGSSSWHNHDSNNSRSYHDNYADNNDYRRSSNNKVFHLKWYHMLAIIFILLLSFSFIIRIGWMLIKLLFTFLVPIIFIAFLWAMFRKR